MKKPMVSSSPQGSKRCTRAACSAVNQSSLYPSSCTQPPIKPGPPKRGCCCTSFKGKIFNAKATLASFSPVHTASHNHGVSTDQTMTLTCAMTSIQNLRNSSCIMPSEVNNSCTQLRGQPSVHRDQGALFAHCIYTKPCKS